ncbi:MAG: hypothetical protein JSW15_08245 [Deltaproteobacteria bacterium]|nr:MAG: hypothetical protein JSW15_08245 [Deltaproteobacteria bacterium]
MKIHPNDEIFKDAYPAKIKKNERSSSREFGAILNEHIENSSKTDAGTKSPPITNTISEIQSDPSPPVGKNPIIDRTETFLDILDEYHQKLGNPQFILKDIYPLINEMEAQNEGLIPVLNSLPDGDELKDILNQVLITSSLEIIKFNRGDYLNP